MLFRYKIIPKSPIMTPIMSDTLFGHFCWSLLYNRGEDYLTDFLNSFGNDKPAPVLFSSAFQTGYLPRPALPPLSRDRVKQFVRKHYGEKKNEQYKGLSAIKDWSKIRFVSLQQWHNLKDDYSEERLYGEFVSEGVHKGKPIYELEVSASNIINRISGAVEQEGGGLFQREKIWYHEGIELDLYVEVNDDEMSGLVKWFLTEYLSEHGFGADKSTGMGSLLISHDETFDPDMFHVDNFNALISLSMVSFLGMEKYDAFYRLKTKFGKLGGSFAVSSPTGGNPRPFKKPILMYEPGAVFFTTESLSNKPLLGNIHSDSRIRHCGIPVTLPFKTREETRYAKSAA
jgi:CRISPR-associated protein Csm4